MSQLESEKRYLDKSNRHLENILEATNAYKIQEVSELNRIHVETIKVNGCGILYSDHCEANYNFSLFNVCCCLADTLTCIVKTHFFFFFIP